MQAPVANRGQSLHTRLGARGRSMLFMVEGRASATCFGHTLPMTQLVPRFLRVVRRCMEDAVCAQRHLLGNFSRPPGRHRAAARWWRRRLLLARLLPYCRSRSLFGHPVTPIDCVNGRFEHRLCRAGNVNAPGRHPLTKGNVDAPERHLLMNGSPSRSPSAPHGLDTRGAGGGGEGAGGIKVNHALNASSPCFFSCTTWMQSENDPFARSTGGGMLGALFASAARCSANLSAAMRHSVLSSSSCA